jgi:NAD(P)-dependent dehydrogenase (short-subunit alcohol dehydrogenase family)
MGTSRWTFAGIGDMSGHTVVVTGASSGIGAVTSRELARAGARVVMAVRDLDKGGAVADTIAGQVEVRQLDLTSLASVRNFAKAWDEDIDILINNAGVMHAPEGRTADGFELHIGTNHLGHFALTNLLLPRVKDRVVNVTSLLSSRGRIDLEDLNWDRRDYSSSQAYADSKLANVLFTHELQRLFTRAGSAARAMSAHPGVAKTNLLSHVTGPAGSLTKLAVSVIAQDVDRGALPILFAATQDIPGNAFVGPGGFAHTRGFPELAQPPDVSQDSERAARLWDLSCGLTNTEFTRPRSF